MNIYITLDYELFFGSNSGSIEKCIIEPTEALLKIVDPYNIKFICYVDAGYLWALEQYKERYSELNNDYHKVSKQIQKLVKEGHGIELHIHPHWEDSFYNGEKWIFDTTRYKLSDFTKNEVLKIVTKYNDVLKRVSGISPVAYRAGGWSAQPFMDIKEALKANDVFIDSTVYPGGYYQSEKQFFDFRSVAPFVTEYNFSDDLTVSNSHGEFKEIPISAHKVSPLFFWKFAWTKLKKSDQHISFGDGNAVKSDRKELLRMLFRTSYTVVSVDGYKSKLIKSAFKKYVKNTSDKGNFVLIGHPKAFTPYSLEKLKSFIEDVSKGHKFKTNRV